MTKAQRLSYIPTSTPTVYTSAQLDPELDLISSRASSRRLFSLSCHYVSPADLKYQLPSAGVAEFAFVGRSNVGKSSLISALVGHSEKLVRISKTPGATRSVNYFSFAKEATSTPAFYLVDMPGYGFARAARTEQAKWTAVMEGFLKQRELSTLRRVFVLVDSRHGLKPSDAEMMDLLNSAGLPYQVVLTKSDASSPLELARALDSVFSKVMSKGRLNSGLPYVHAVSSKNGQGIDELKDSVAEILSHDWKAREKEVSEEQRAFAAELLRKAGSASLARGSGDGEDGAYGEDDADDREGEREEVLAMDEAAGKRSVRVRVRGRGGVQAGRRLSRSRSRS